MSRRYRMTRRFARRRRPTPATLIALLALVVALGPSAIAEETADVARLITGKQIKKNAVTSKHVRNGSLQLVDMSQTARTGLRGEAGPAGPAGPAGREGATGAAGPPGPPGSDAQFNGAAAGGALNGAYPNPGITDNAVGPSQIAPDSVGSSELRPGAVGTSNTGTIPAARATRTADLSVPASTETAVPFTAEDFDGILSSSIHSNVTNPSRFTAPVAGVYSISANVSWGGAAGGTRYVELEHSNGNTLAAAVVSDLDDSSPRQEVSTLVSLAEDEYVRVIVHQNTANPVNIDAFFSGPNTPYFTPAFEMFWVGPAL